MYQRILEGDVYATEDALQRLESRTLERESLYEVSLPISDLKVATDVTSYMNGNNFKGMLYADAQMEDENMENSLITNHDEIMFLTAMAISVFTSTTDIKEIHITDLVNQALTSCRGFFHYSDKGRMKVSRYYRGEWVSYQCFLIIPT